MRRRLLPVSVRLYLLFGASTVRLSSTCMTPFTFPVR